MHHFSLEQGPCFGGYHLLSLLLLLLPLLLPSLSLSFLFSETLKTNISYFYIIFLSCFSFLKQKRRDASSWKGPLVPQLGKGYYDCWSLRVEGGASNLFYDKKRKPDYGMAPTLREMVIARPSGWWGVV
jgi:hypothetical protein